MRDFVQADNFVRFGPDIAPLRCAPVKARAPLGETKKFSACSPDASAFVWLHSLAQSRVSQ
jgi:hypothetical protein